MPRPAAKPIIDLLAATGDLDGVGAREGDLHVLGYEFHRTGMPGRLLYRCGPASAWAYHLHVFQASRLPTRNQLLLRDYLRGNADDAARHDALKRRLAALHDNGDDYTRARTELVQELTDTARAEGGLPPAPVREE